MTEAVEIKRPSAIPPTPAPSLRVPDHPLSTMLREGGQETGAGVGGIEVRKEIHPNSEREIKKEKGSNKTQRQRGEKDRESMATDLRSLIQYAQSLLPKISPLSLRLETTNESLRASLFWFRRAPESPKKNTHLTKEDINV